MYSTIHSATIHGIEAMSVHVEVDASPGLPSFLMVGYLSSEVREAGERVRVALKNSGISIPPSHITVNLSPADIRKEGTAFDLPIAVGIMQSLGYLTEERVRSHMIVGELSLDGTVNPVKGILPLVKMAREEGYAGCILPAKNKVEGELIPGVRIIGAATLSGVLQYLQQTSDPPESGAFVSAPPESAADFSASAPPESAANSSVSAPPESAADSSVSVPPESAADSFASASPKSGSQPSASLPSESASGLSPCAPSQVSVSVTLRPPSVSAALFSTPSQPDFADINGQPAARRCAEIAAAGFHHLLLVGPPGSGKTMLAKRLPTILPPLTMEESLEVSVVYSVAGLLSEDRPLIDSRPFLSPHHTITETALAGGGRIPHPGIISLAHRGVLFLDEMTEFKQNVLELLRQPLEDKEIHIARLGGNYVYPANFILVGAMNPCPCGYYPDLNRCRCTPPMIARYKRRISGPILDRMDLCAEAPRVTLEELKGNGCAKSAQSHGSLRARFGKSHNSSGATGPVRPQKNEDSRTIRARVMAARQIQEERYKGKPFHFNADLTPQEIGPCCRLGTAEQKLMEQVYGRLQLSARAYFKILRVARTIADLDGGGPIREIHLAEAVSCRASGEKYWEK